MRLTTTTFALLATALIRATSAAAEEIDYVSFDWTKVEPNVNLVYHPCYEGFQCARLQVPLDWQNTSDSRVAVIEIVKLPAIVPESNATYGSPILTNPGGPGGSGTYSILRTAKPLRKLIDRPGHKHYDYVSFDPRGVSHSTPKIDCYRGDPVSLIVYNSAVAPLTD